MSGQEKNQQSYAEWIKNVQEERNAKANWRCNVAADDSKEPMAEAVNPPKFPFVTLFQSDVVETYSSQMTSKSSGIFLQFL